MACQTFHSFPKLPFEIRLEIWKLSIRPTTRYDGAITYIFRDDLGFGHCELPSAAPFSFDKEQPVLPNKTKEVGVCCRSAYLWDTGL